MNTRKYTINNMDYNVAVNSFTGDSAEVTVNGVTYQVRIACSDDSAAVQSTGIQASAPAAPDVQEAASAHIQAGTGRQLKSPLPGVILDVKVRAGDIVKEGQVVAVLEAMKMENEIQSEYAGTVTSVNVSPGDPVLEGTCIVTIG